MSNAETPQPLGQRPILAGLMERIVESPNLLVAIETPRPEAILDQLRQSSLREGQAVYHFVPGVGVGSLRQPGVHVPGTRGAYDALRHIDASSHFGIYVFHPVSSLGLVAGSAVLNRLQALAALAEAAVAGKRIVLLDRYIGLDASLEPSTTRVYDRPERAGRRLRNGRWVE